MSRLLGIDEGTSAVKALLYDADSLAVPAEARREQPLSYPRPGWVEQDPDAVLDAVVGGVADLLAPAPGEGDASGLGHHGDSVVASDREAGGPLTPLGA